MRVLIIEDRSAIADFVQRGLREAGFAVDLAGDGGTGLASVLAAAYDAIVLEQMLPDMAGRDLLRELRGRGRYTPALVLTTHRTTDEDLAASDPVCEVLVKPFAFPELVGRLHAVSRRRASQASTISHPRDSAQVARAAGRTGQDFQRLLDLVPYATVVVDEQGRIIRVNWLAEQLFGYGREEIAGRPFEILVLEPTLDQHIQQRARHLASPHARGIDDRYESVGVRRDGTQFAAEIGLDPLVGVEGLLILITIRDITSRREAEETLRHSRQQLRELSARLLTTREEEGARIARMIHDDLGQALTGLKMDLAWLQKHLSQDQDDLLAKTRAMAELIDSTVQTVRRIATELRPGILDHVGLLAAIEWQLGEFQRRTGIRCRLSSTVEETTLDSAGATAAFRIVQEGLTNVARHAQASEVEVAVEETAEALVLRVRDNGRGIREREIHSPKSIGLLGMRERALLRGGEVRIDGISGKGTTLTVRLPLGRE